MINLGEQKSIVSPWFDSNAERLYGSSTSSFWLLPLDSSSHDCPCLHIWCMYVRSSVNFFLKKSKLFLKNNAFVFYVVSILLKLLTWQHAVFVFYCISWILIILIDLLVILIRIESWTFVFSEICLSRHVKDFNQINCKCLHISF